MAMQLELVIENSEFSPFQAGERARGLRELCQIRSNFLSLAVEQLWAVCVDR